MRDGKVINNGNFNIDLNPQSSKIVEIPIRNFLKEINQENNDFHLNVYGYLRNGKNLIPSGHMIFKEQMEIKESISSYSLSNSNKMLKVESSDNLLKVYNDDINVVFDNSNGDLISYVVNDKEFIDKAPHLNFWRAPIDNDYGNNLPLRSKEWKVASNKRVLRNINHELLDKNIKVTVNYSLANLKSYYTTTFLINPEGELRISNDFNYKGNLKDAEMPRLV